MYFAFRIDPVILTKSEVTEILGKAEQRPGTYLLYEDVEKERIFLSFRYTSEMLKMFNLIILKGFFYRTNIFLCKPIKYIYFKY